MKTLCRHFIFVVIFILQGCDDTKLSPLHEGSTILAFGDSLTFGVGVSKPNSYPSVLSELSGRTVFNAGVSGEVTADGLLRLPTVLDQTEPNLLILLEGGNDILRNSDLRQSKNNLAEMIEIAHGRGIEVVLIGVPEKKLFSDVAPFYRELAEEYELVFEDDLISDLLHKNQYKSDRVHFNQLGYQKMAEAIYKLLDEKGAL